MRRAASICLTLTLTVALACASFATAWSATPDASAAPPSASSTLWPPPALTTTWQAPARSHGASVHLHLLAFNDFHGNLEPPAHAGGRPAGGAAVLAAYLEQAERADPEHTLLLHAGDQIGASPPLARLLRNEPSIEFLNLLANEHCAYGAATRFYDAASWRSEPNRCNVVGTLGNHEFDAGVPELMRVLTGGNASDGPFLENPWRGSRVPYVSANVIDRHTGRTLLPAYAVVVLGDTPIGVIGAVVRETPILAPAWAVADVSFLDEAEAINRAAAELQRQGIHTLVVVIHQGVVPERTAAGLSYQGPLSRIVAQLDPDIDVVVSGHTHNYTNTLMPNRAGQPVLVTQAYAFGTAFARIDLEIDRTTGDVVAKSAQIVPTWADAGPGLTPDARVAALTASAAKRVAPRIARIVGHAAEPITRTLTPGGESALGDLVADAQRSVTHADIALMNPGGLRTDLKAGDLTWGEILTLHPFGNRLETLTLSGAQLLRVLEEQWPPDPDQLPRVLKTSGLYYSWDPRASAGHHIVSACDADRQPLDPARSYRVTVNDFLAAGGDGFDELKGAPVIALGPLDSEALAQYVAALAQPVTGHVDGRIVLAADGADSPCRARR